MYVEKLNHEFQDPEERQDDTDAVQYQDDVGALGMQVHNI